MHVLEIVSALKKHRSFSADQQKKYDPTRYGLQYTTIDPCYSNLFLKWLKTSLHYGKR